MILELDLIDETEKLERAALDLVEGLLQFAAKKT